VVQGDWTSTTVRAAVVEAWERVSPVTELSSARPFVVPMLAVTVPPTVTVPEQLAQETGCVTAEPSTLIAVEFAAVPDRSTLTRPPVVGASGRRFVPSDPYVTAKGRVTVARRFPVTVPEP